MRAFVPFLLSLCIFFVSTAYGEYGRIANSPLLRSAVSRLFTIPQVAEQMAWQNGGITIDNLIELLRILEPKAYGVWDASSKYDGHKRFLLGTTIRNEMRDEVFSLHGPLVSKWSDYRSNWYADDSTKYFWGEAEPDIKAMIAEVMFTPESLIKMEWENGGLSSDAIVADFKEKYPDVYTLYAQASATKTDAWLRDLVQGRMHEDSSDRHKLGDYFTMRVTVDGKTTHKFFRGNKKPDLRVSLSTAISNAGLLNKMEDSGITMDEIVAALKNHSRVYTLYVQASGSERGLRIALGKAMRKIGNITSRKDSEGTKRYFWTEIVAF